MTSAISSTASAAPAIAGASGDKLKKTAQSFEAIVLRQMIGSMRSASLADDEDLFGSSAGQQFRDMGDARLAEDMAKKGGFGITEMLMKQYGAKAAPAGTVESPKGGSGK